MKKILAILLSLILLFTNMGFSMTTHYCGGHAVKSKLVLGDKSVDCGMEKMDDNCETGSGTSITKKSCCENHFMSLSVENEFQPTVAQPSLDVNFVFTFVYTYLELFSSNIEHETSYGEYSPPPKKQSRQVLFQSFLI